MKKRLWILGLAFLFSVSAFAGVSQELMRLAMRDPGHRELEKHEFIQRLKNQSFEKEQVAQFFKDRIYFTEVMESILRESQDPFWKLPSILTPSGRLFYRSFTYQQELRSLLGWSREPSPSRAAIDYGEYLKTRSAEIVAVHLWVFLVGETFGAQHMSDYFQEKFKTVGVASKSFESLTPPEARRVFNRWIDRMVGESSVDLEIEISAAYGFLIDTFDSALEAPRLSWGWSPIGVGLPSCQIL